MTILQLLDVQLQLVHTLVYKVEPVIACWDVVLLHCEIVLKILNCSLSVFKLLNDKARYN